MDEFRWKNGLEVPTFLGIIQNPDHHDGTEVEEINEDFESYVTFVLAGRFQWIDSDIMNTMSAAYKDECSNIFYPPEDKKPIKYRKCDPLRHFVKGNGRWECRNHKNLCMGFASP